MDNWPINFGQKTIRGKKVRPALLMLVAYLKANNNRIISNDEIRKKFNMKPSSIRTTLNEIRRIFGNTEPIPIKTIMGSGYQWADDSGNRNSIIITKTEIQELKSCISLLDSISSIYNIPNDRIAPIVGVINKIIEKK